jgi:hypothetical protein
VNLPRRKVETPPDADVLVQERPVKAGGKNAPTPRRNHAQAARKQQLKGTPRSKKEVRARRNEIYNETRAAMKQTDVNKLPANERKAELIYVRDLVDSRANLASALFPVIAVYLVVSTVFHSKNDGKIIQPVILLVLLWLVAMVVDAVIMSRKVETRVRARFPDSTEKVRVYAGRRAFAPKRFMRRPVPREVPPGNRWRDKPAKATKG